MCILFMYVDNNAPPDGYQVIVAVNRDEYYHRPTQAADIWNGKCISGLDMEPGREGGTWFGTSKTSKSGALLNILDPVPSGEKKGRGHLVTNYLSGNEDVAAYIGRIAHDRSDYNCFNLVLWEKINGKWSVYYLSSKDEESPCQMPHGILAFGNSVYGRPWQKVIHGKEEFRRIVDSFNSVSKQKELKEELLKLMSDRTSYFPDLQLASQSPVKFSSEEILTARSAVYVDLGRQFQYGTRTHTLLLIDGKDRCQYIEKTISDPNDCSNPVWKTVTHNYVLEEGDATEK